MAGKQHTDSRWVKRLLRWFVLNARPMPWRKRSTPYRVWISEIMLQQTQVETATPYFRRFMRQFPSIRKLAAADTQSVLKAWEGLGYYSRARHLHKAARIITGDYRGRMPRNAADLQKLPGVGPYSAAAIASISFGEAVPCVDGNVIRVICRFQGICADSTTATTRRRIVAFLEKHIPTNTPGDFNQALMELGALVCRPLSPRCGCCPLKTDCRALASNRVHLLPKRPRRAPLPHYHVAACVIWKNGKLLITRRRTDQMLGGLWEFPGGKQKRSESIESTAKREIREELGIGIDVVRPIFSMDHSYTHFKITLHFMLCHHISGRPRAIQCDALRWVKPVEMGEYPFPATDKKMVLRIQKAKGPSAF
jgi:A/G-specific adenine glycosylase